MSGAALSEKPGAPEQCRRGNQTLDTASRESPAVSVIIPAFNAQDTIAATLASVLSQTWTCFDVTVVDDGSTDRTAAIVEPITRKDRRIRLCRQENAGVAEARNRGIRESTGEWIAPLDADDLWSPSNLESQVQQAQRACARVAVVYSWSTRIDGKGLFLPGVTAASVRGKVLSTLLCHNFLGNASCTLIRRSALESVGGYDQRFSPTDDWDLYLRLAEHYEFVPVRRFSVRYRQSLQSASSNHDSMADGQARMLQEMRHRNSSVPAWLCKLSQSNLYIYFAKRSGEHGDAAAVRRWVRKASEAHWLAMMRPGWWRLWAFGGARRRVKPAAAASSIRRSVDLLSQLIGSRLLHISLRLMRPCKSPETAARA